MRGKIGRRKTKAVKVGSEWAEKTTEIQKNDPPQKTRKPAVGSMDQSLVIKKLSELERTQEVP